jgi:DnaJ-domain-containing protein 1
MSKEKSLSKMEAQLKQSRSQLDEFRARAEKATAEGRLEYAKLVETVEAKDKDMGRRIDELRAAGEDGFAVLKREYEAAWQDYSSAVRGVRRG